MPIKPSRFNTFTGLCLLFVQFERKKALCEQNSHRARFSRAPKKETQEELLLLGCLLGSFLSNFLGRFASSFFCRFFN
jgi:hypothetical protein